MHRERLKEIKKTMDTTNHVYEEQMIREQHNRSVQAPRVLRSRVIDHDNLCTINNLMHIALTPSTRIDNGQTPYPASGHARPHTQKSLNSNNVVKDHDRVARENLKTGTRLLRVKAYMDHRVWTKHEKDYLDFKQRHSKYMYMSKEEFQNRIGRAYLSCPFKAEQFLLAETGRLPSRRPPAARTVQPHHEHLRRVTGLSLLSQPVGRVARKHTKANTKERSTVARVKAAQELTISPLAHTFPNTTSHQPTSMTTSTPIESEKYPEYQTETNSENGQEPQTLPVSRADSSRSTDARHRHGAAWHERAQCQERVRDSAHSAVDHDSARRACVKPTRSGTRVSGRAPLPEHLRTYRVHPRAQTMQEQPAARKFVFRRHEKSMSYGSDDGDGSCSGPDPHPHLPDPPSDTISDTHKDLHELPSVALRPAWATISTSHRELRPQDASRGENDPEEREEARSGEGEREEASEGGESARDEMSTRSHYVGSRASR
jgi:hypothetical protein